MNRTPRFVLLFLFLGACLAGAPKSVPAATAPAAAVTGGEAAPAVFLAEPPAQSKPSGHTEMYDWINFLLLVAVLVYVLRKPVSQFFSGRAAELERDLEAGRKALEAARSQLAAAEEKLRRLEQDIAALKASATQEREADRERFHRVGEEEAQRIFESARTMIQSATQAAKMELKAAAVREAVALAEVMIRERLDEASRAMLVSRFLERIGKGLKN